MYVRPFLPICKHYILVFSSFVRERLGSHYFECFALFGGQTTFQILYNQYIACLSFHFLFEVFFCRVSLFCRYFFLSLLFGLSVVFFSKCMRAPRPNVFFLKPLQYIQAVSCFRPSFTLEIRVNVGTLLAIVVGVLCSNLLSYADTLYVSIHPPLIARLRVWRDSQCIPSLPSCSLAE